MDKSNLKNIVILKNLPSNIVDEAIVILKPNQKIKKLEIIEKNQNIKGLKEERKSSNYILKEAEELVKEYISKIDKTEEKQSKTLKEKYQKQKKYLFFLSAILFMSILLHLI